MTTQRKKEDIIRDLYSSVICAPGIDGVPPPMAPEAFNEFFNGVSEAFADCTLSVDELRVSGSRIMARYTACGRQEKDFLGVSPTNQKMVIIGVDVFRLEGDRVVEYRNVAHQISVPGLNSPSSALN